MRDITRRPCSVQVYECMLSTTGCLYSVSLCLTLSPCVFLCFCQFYWLKKKLKNGRVITVPNINCSHCFSKGSIWPPTGSRAIWGGPSSCCGNTPFSQSNYGHTSASASAFDCCCCYGIPGRSQVSVVAANFHVITNGIFWCETSCPSLALDLCSLAEDFKPFGQTRPEQTPNYLQLFSQIHQKKLMSIPVLEHSDLACLLSWLLL